MSNKSTKTEDNKDDEFGRSNIGEKMSMKLLLDGINQRHKKVFFWLKKKEIAGFNFYLFAL